MSERERIEAMVSDGTLTREEGDRLLAVLDDLDGVDRDMAAMDADLDAAREAAAGADPAASGEPRAAPDPAPTEADPARAETGTVEAGAGGAAASDAGADDARTADPSAERGGRRPSGESLEERIDRAVQGAAAGVARAMEGIGRAPDRAADATAGAATGQRWLPIAPDGVKWLRVEMIAGDIEIRADPDADAPAITHGKSGDLDVIPTDDGAVFRQVPRGGDRSFLDRLIGGLGRGDVEIVLPEGWGLELAMRAGDAELHGVRWLRGSLTAGDLDADALEGIDLTMSAGDVDIGLRPTVGEHRLVVSAGDVDVRLLRGSSARVTGQVSIGDVDAPAPLTSRRTGLGEKLEGTIGEGAAELLLRVSTGDLDLAVEGS